MKNFSVKAIGLGAKDAPLKKYNELIRGMQAQRSLRTKQLHTFKQLRTDIHKLQFLPQITLVQLPNTGNEGVLFSCAASQPPINLLKMKIKFRIFL